MTLSERERRRVRGRERKKERDTDRVKSTRQGCNAHTRTHMTTSRTPVTISRDVYPQMDANT